MVLVMAKVVALVGGVRRGSAPSLGLIAQDQDLWPKARRQEGTGQPPLAPASADSRAPRRGLVKRTQAASTDLAPVMALIYSRLTEHL